MGQIHSALAAWMSEKAGCYPWLKLCFPQVTGCGDHTWVAPVWHGSLENCTADSSYYRRAGQLLGITYLINLTGLHHENIIATATQPIPVDLEVITSVLPRVPEDQPDAPSITLRQTTSSPTSTGLIPLDTSFEKLGGDISGLAASGLRVHHYALDRQGRSDMRYIHTIAEVTLVDHLPALGNDPVLAANYVDEIVEGFALALQITMKYHNDPETFICDNTSNLHIWVLARMSDDYATVLAGLPRVGYNTNPEQPFSILCRNSAGLAESMADSKEEQLRTWAIPHLQAIASEITIRDPWGRPTGRLHITSVAQTTARIRAITEIDINRHISLIRMTFHKPEEVILPLDPRLTTQGTGSFEEFERIHLQAQTVTGADGSVNWRVLTVDEREQLAVQPLLDGLYRGIAGMAELLMIIPHRDAQCHQLITSPLRTLQLEADTMISDSGTSLSYYHGPASCLAATHRYDQVFGFSAPWLRHHYDRFLTIVESIAPDDTKPGALLDVMKGPAGLIIALRHHSDVRIHELCHRLGLPLTDAASEGWDLKKVCALSRNISLAHDAGRHGDSRADRRKNGI